MSAIATAAVAAAKVAISLAAKRREAVERGEKEPLITEERVARAKAKAKKLIAKARSEEARERRQERRGKIRDVFRRDDDELDVEGDAPRRRRPPTSDRPMTRGRGAVLWPEPRDRASGGTGRGVSMVDPGVEGFIQLDLQPMHLREAAEILHALTRINVAQMRAGTRPISRGLADGAIVYGRPEAGTQFKTLDDLWQDGVGDCGPLSAAYAAERTLAGHPSVPYLYYARPGVIHAVVRDLKTGELFDPSIAAGMGQ